MVDLFLNDASFVEQFPNAFEHCLGFFKNLVVPESDNRDTASFDEPRSPNIAMTAFRSVVLSAVQLDRQIRTVTIEVYDVMIEWMLSAKLHAVKPPVSQKFP